MNIDKVFDQFTTFNKSAGSFELTKLWLQQVEEINVSATAAAVMTALLWHYNPMKKYVFPHQETLAKRVKRSLATVKRALKELREAGYIITIRKRSGNVYAFTKKFFEEIEPSKSATCTIPKGQNELSSCHEHDKGTSKNNNNVVSFENFYKSKGGKEEAIKGACSTTASASSKTLQDIPDILKRKAATKEIRNLNAYWNSLRAKGKEEWWEKDREEKLKLERAAAFQAEEVRRKEAAEAEKEAIKEEMKKPLTERYTREEAIKLVRNFSKVKRGAAARAGFLTDLIKAFNIDVTKV